jgi:hypothetical protein
MVYATEVQSPEDLWQHIDKAFESIRTVFERVRESLRRRAEACITDNGNHFEHQL